LHITYTRYTFTPMITTNHHTAAKLRRIELRKQIAELDIKEDTLGLLSEITLVLGFVFTIIAIIL
jgi:hypothetical protein